MSALPYNDWVDEDKYMREMARIHKLQPKPDVIDILLHEFSELQSNSDYKLQYIKERRQWLLATLSAQIVALSLELTDDLAAVCVAYLETLKNGDRAFVEHLSKFGSGEGHRFYDAVTRDRNEAARAVGLDPETAPPFEIDAVTKQFAEIKDMRDKFWDYYIGYKHGQFATPMVLTFSSPGAEPKQEWGLDLIPPAQEGQSRQSAYGGQFHQHGRQSRIVLQHGDVLRQPLDPDKGPAVSEDIRTVDLKLIHDHNNSEGKSEGLSLFE
jgi:hypothetical protein